MKDILTALAFAVSATILIWGLSHRACAMHRNDRMAVKESGGYSVLHFDNHKWIDLTTTCNNCQ